MHRTDLTNSLHSFLNSCVIEKGLSDFHETVATVMETSSQKFKPKAILWRNCKDICSDIFRESLYQIFPHNLENRCDKDVDNFCYSAIRFMETH